MGMMQCLIQTNIREERERTKMSIYKKSIELNELAGDATSLNARCLLSVEKMKLQLRILKLQATAQRKAATMGMRVTAKAWTPPGSGSESSSGRNSGQY